MNPHLSSLEAAVRAISFLNDTQFSWLGTPSEAITPAIRRTIGPEKIREFIRYQLQRTLYNQFYTKGTPSPHADEANWVPGDTDFVAALAAANRGRGSVENGWMVRAIRAGRVLLERGGLTLEVDPEMCVPPVADPLVSPVNVCLHVPNAKPNFSPGYYLVVGDAPIPQDDSSVRLYWHLSPENAAYWVQCATEALNSRDLPFRLKVLCASRLFTRCDAGVLYLARSVFETATPLLADIYRRVGARLRSEVPAFTRPLAPGLGLAESPRNESFGMHRCGLIAAGLVRSQTKSRTDVAGHLNCVLACWAEAGLRIERPYLNPGAQDVYETLQLSNGQRAAVAPIREHKWTIEPSACLNVAAEIGTSLAREAIWDSGRCTWLGAEMLGPGITSYGTLSANVYSGTAGLGLFLAALWKVTREKEIRQAAIGAIRQALAGVEALREENMLGLYTGALGVCWAAVRAAISLGETELVDDAAIQLRLCRDHTNGNTKEEWDLLTGQAGAILGLLWLRHSLADDSLLDWATLLGVSLIAAGKRDRAGRLCWLGHSERGTRALTGYSHGAAGAGIALLELGAAVREKTFKEAGLAAFAYERRWYNVERANWPDFRRNRGGLHQLPQRFSTAWCHGAPGIALSRHLAMQVAPDPQIAAELHAALETTKRATGTMLDLPGASFCLCHGLAGNAEVLSLCVGGAVPSLVWRIAAHGRQTYGTGRLAWPGGPHLGSAPGLMLGRAGIGYFYLRLFDPSVPSVLLPYA